MCALLWYQAVDIWLKFSCTVVNVSNKLSFELFILSEEKTQLLYFTKLAVKAVCWVGLFNLNIHISCSSWAFLSPFTHFWKYIYDSRINKNIKWEVDLNYRAIDAKNPSHSVMLVCYAIYSSTRSSVMVENAWTFSDKLTVL